MCVTSSKLCSEINFQLSCWESGGARSANQKVLKVLIKKNQEFVEIRLACNPEVYTSLYYISHSNLYTSSFKFCVRVEMKGYSIFPNMSLTIRCSLSRTPVMGVVLLLCSNAVGVFYSPNRLGLIRTGCFTCAALSCAYQMFACDVSYAAMLRKVG